MDENYINEILLNDHKTMISKDFFVFLINIFKYIFIKRNSSEIKTKIEKQLNSFLDLINKKIIKIEHKFINLDYSIKNFNNIVNFVKKQNLLFAGDILEEVLIYVFSFAFHSDKDNTFGKYIFSNIYRLKDPSNLEIKQFFNEKKFSPKELQNFGPLLLAKDIEWEEGNIKDEYSCIHNLLFQIFKEKFIYINKYNQNSKTNQYLLKGLSDNQKICENIYRQFGGLAKTILEKDYEENSIMRIYLGLNENTIPLKLFLSFLIQVFIYYQNKNSPLMKYIVKDKNLESIDYVYDLRGACIEGRFSSIIISPLRLEPRIRSIQFSQNNLREVGLYEIGKFIIFNKNTKTLELDTCLFRGNFIEFFNCITGLFDNYSVEKLNLSFNYFKDNCEIYLAKLISHFKGLKTLNLTANEFKRGISSTIIILKKLYRQKKIKLEKLMINRSLLDDAFYYEIGELLKCKFCKLKYLYLNFNSMPNNINFLKKIKKNKTLVQISLNKNDITNDDSNDIMRIINHTELRSLYLFKNRITNFDAFLRIIYRTKLIKDEGNLEPIIGDQSFLSNLDLSNNDILIKNKNHIRLFNNIIKQTNLYCLDISHILLGFNPSKNKSNILNAYKSSVDKLKEELDEDKNNYIKIICSIRKNNVDKKKFKDLENKEIFKSISKDKINEIITHKNAKLPVYLREQARIILISDDIKDKINIDNLSYDQLDNLEDDLVKYLILKRSEKDLKVLEKKRIDKKIIII